MRGSLFSLILFIHLVLPCTFELEAENNVYATGSKRYRSKASNGITEYLHKGEKCILKFETRMSSCSIKITDVIYSNDGGTDQVYIYIDDIYAGKFHSVAYSNYGHNWNIFRSSGSIGGYISTSGNLHNITFQIKKADSYGVELDVIHLSLECNYQKASNSMCPNEYLKRQQNDKSCKKELEIEDGTNSSLTAVYRSEASGHMTVRMKESDSALVHFITPKSQCSIQILDVYYSNDGLSDTINVYLDENYMGMFTTIPQSNGGNYWNVFKSSGSSPFMFHDISGSVHNISFYIEYSDNYGVELDAVSLNVRCLNETNSQIECMSSVIRVFNPLNTLPIENSIADNQSCVAKFEAESAALSYTKIMFRSRASNGFTVKLHAHQNITLDFQIQKPDFCFISVSNITYSNDGSVDTLSVHIDNQYIGNFNTLKKSNGGYLWNVIRSSGLVGEKVKVKGTHHNITLIAEHSDIYGLELDAVNIKFECFSNDKFIYSCDDINAQFTISHDGENGNGTCKIEIEIEDAVDTHGRITYRSMASSGFTLHLDSGGRLKLNFETRKYNECFVEILDVTYSNDGLSDTIYVYVDDVSLGFFKTTAQTDGGNLWNIMKSSGNFGKMVNITGSSHSIIIDVESNGLYGVELDKMSVNLECRDEAASTKICISQNTDLYDLDHDCNFEYEAEDAEIANGIQMYRSEASNGITVRMKPSGELRIHFKTTQQQCFITFPDITYSDDGISTRINVYVDGEYVGYFRSSSATNKGVYWNVMRSTGPIGGRVKLSSGSHNTTLKGAYYYSLDHAIELDKITINLECMDESTQKTQCVGYKDTFNSPHIQDYGDPTSTSTQGDSAKKTSGMDYATVVPLITILHLMLE